jgi:hypothetical protein
MPSLGEIYNDLKAAYGDERSLDRDILTEMRKNAGESKSDRENRITAILTLWNREVIKNIRKTEYGAKLLEGMDWL